MIVSRILSYLTVHYTAYKMFRHLSIAILLTLLFDSALSKAVRWNPVLIPIADFDSSNQKKIQNVDELTCSIVTSR